MIREVTNMNKHELYHNHNYVYLLTSNIINRCGDSLDTILFTWLVYLLTNSAGWSAIIFGINQATSVIIQPFIGPLVENMNKKKVLVLSDIARVLLVLYILYVYTQNMLSPLILVFMTISISLIEAFHMPAGVAVIQHVLPNEHYDKGVSVNVSFFSDRCFDIFNISVAYSKNRIFCSRRKEDKPNNWQRIFNFA